MWPRVSHGQQHWSSAEVETEAWKSSGDGGTNGITTLDFCLFELQMPKEEKQANKSALYFMTVFSRTTVSFSLLSFYNPRSI